MTHKTKTADTKKRSWQYYTYSYVIPFIGVVAILFFMSACSPLFQFEYNIIDFNCTMSIAKAIGHGEVYFKDIFEQRGIYLYFIHLFAAFMPYYYARLCVWILEVINLYCFYLILRMTGMQFGFKPKKHEAWFVYSWVALLLVMLFPIWPTFSNSAAPEEWCIIPVAYAIYLTFKYDVTKKLTLPESLLLGLGMGWIINVKYSVMMIPAGFFFSVGLHLLFTKRFKHFFEVAGTAIGGVILGSIPAFTYFALNHAIGDWLKYYFLDNASSISISTGPQIFSYYMIMFGLFLTVFMVGCCLSIQKMTYLGLKIMLSVTMFGILGVILIGRTSIAYPMPLMVLSNMMAIVGILGTKTWVLNASKSFRYFIIISQLVIIASYGFNMIRQPSYQFTGSLRVLTPNYLKDNNTKSESYKASKIIEKFGGGKVLTLGAITNDIYMYNNEYPKFFYFDQTTMSYKRYPKSFDTQLSYVAKGKPTWVEFSTLISVMPPDMSNKQYNHYVNVGHKSYSTIKGVNFAEVTAGAEYQALHPAQYRTYGQETIYQNGYRYNVELSEPKVLLKNYALIYMGLSDDDITRIYHVVCNCEMLWVNKKMLIKHPELKKYVIDPGNINGTLNKYNSYEHNHQ